MKKVALPDVEDGMILAEPLIGSSGNILMGKGIAIKASIVPRLAAWGVSHVVIEGEPNPAELSTQQDDDQLGASLEMLFAGKLTTPPMDIIYQCLLRYRSRNEYR